MKKNILSIICAAAAMTAAVSCANKENTEPETPSRSPMQFSAGTPALADFSSDVRTAIGEDGMSVLWSEDDVIGIFDTRINKFDLIAGAGTSTGRFSGFALPETQLYALYPYDETASISGSTISATLPSVQYSVADGTFDTMLNPAVAKPDASNNLAFDHVAAMLKITIDGGISSAVKSISLAADKSLAGAYTVDMSQDTFSAVAASSETPVSVSLTGKDGANLAADPYYLVILPGTYSNLTLTVTLADGTAATGTISNLTVAARDIKETTVTLGDFEQSEFGFAPTEDLTFSYKGQSKEYTVNASAGTAWTLSADSEDVTLSVTEGTGTQNVTVTLPYSKYIYNKTYTLTLKADGQTDITRTVTQNACVNVPNTDGTLTANNANVMLETTDHFKYGTFIWKISNVNLTGGCINIQAYSDDTVTPTEGRESPYMMMRYGSNISNMAAGGSINISNSWNASIIACFGYDNGWNDSSDENITCPLANLPSSVNDVTEIKLILAPSTRTGVDGNGISANILTRQIYINGQLVLDNHDGSTWNNKNVPVDIWQGKSTHPGFQWVFGLSNTDESDPASGSMTIDSFEYIPYSAQ